mgnify:CR=1 FL=1
MRFRPWVQWQGDRQDYQLVIAGEAPDGKSYPVTNTVGAEPLPYRHAAAPVSLEARYEGDGWFNVQDFLRPLVDECYRVGIVPSAEVADSHAMRAHLKDMRALAFGTLKIDKP